MTFYLLIHSLGDKKDEGELLQQFIKKDMSDLARWYINIGYAGSGKQWYVYMITALCLNTNKY